MINSNADPTSVTNMDHCRQRIQDAVHDIEDNRILEEEPAIATEAGEINDGDLNTFQILLNMRVYGEA